MFIANVGDAMSICGTTIVPLMSYLVPLGLFIRSVNHRPIIDTEKLTCCIFFILVVIITILMNYH